MNENIARLVTNLEYATIIRGGGPVRTNVTALVIGTDNLTGTTHKVRGFGPDGAWVVFDLVLNCDAYDYTVALAVSEHTFIGTDGRSEPLCHGAIYEWTDGTRIELVIATPERAIDVLDDQTFPEVWDVLKEKAAEYWPHPWMPTLVHGPTKRQGSRRDPIAEGWNKQVDEFWESLRRG